MAYTGVATPGKTPDRSSPTVHNIYLVVGPKRVLGHVRGEAFEATLSVDQERHLIGAGHIVIAPEPEVEAEAEGEVEAEEAPELVKFRGGLSGGKSKG